MRSDPELVVLREIDGTQRLWTNPEWVVEILSAIDPPSLTLHAQVAQGAIDRLKFAEALPAAAAVMVIERRIRNDPAVRNVGSWTVRSVHQSGS